MKNVKMMDLIRVALIPPGPKGKERRRCQNAIVFLLCLMGLMKGSSDYKEQMSSHLIQRQPLSIEIHK